MYDSSWCFMCKLMEFREMFIKISESWTAIANNKCNFEIKFAKMKQTRLINFDES